MNIVLWIGNESNQKALANKIQAVVPLAGIVTETRKTIHKYSVSKIFEKLIEKLFLTSIASAWWGMKKHFEAHYPEYPNVKRFDVENINEDSVFDFTSGLSPDLVIVSGTRLIKEKLLSVKPSIGILNLHTGLSPYIKGGPNCTNWCIATKQYHLIGNTIMWIDKGIDSGNIIYTELTEFTGNETLSDIHLKVMEHAHEMYLKTILLLLKGNHVPNINQTDLAKGKTYYTKNWGLKEKIQLVNNLNHFRKAIQSTEIMTMKQTVKTVKPDA